MPFLRSGYVTLGTTSDYSSYSKNTQDSIVSCNVWCLVLVKTNIFICSWGRGHPEEYTEAIAIGEEKFDVDSDKKPRAGQILWIRGLTRLQTQVSTSIVYIATFAMLPQNFSTSG